jgi:hypothetical protein
MLLHPSLPRSLKSVSKHPKTERQREREREGERERERERGRDENLDSFS